MVLRVSCCSLQNYAQWNVKVIKRFPRFSLNFQADFSMKMTENGLCAGFNFLLPLERHNMEKAQNSLKVRICILENTQVNLRPFSNNISVTFGLLECKSQIILRLHCELWVAESKRGKTSNHPCWAVSLPFRQIRADILKNSRDNALLSKWNNKFWGQKLS